jgi:hypothetical protein
MVQNGSYRFGLVKQSGPTDLDLTVGNRDRGKRLTGLRVPSSFPARHDQMSNNGDALGVSEGNEVVDGM